MYHGNVCRFRCKQGAESHIRRRNEETVNMPYCCNCLYQFPVSVLYTIGHWMSMLAFFTVRPLNPANFAAIFLLKFRLSLFVFSVYFVQDCRKKCSSRNISWQFANLALPVVLNVAATVFPSLFELPGRRSEGSRKGKWKLRSSVHSSNAGRGSSI